MVSFFSFFISFFLYLFFLYVFLSFCFFLRFFLSVCFVVFHSVFFHSCFLSLPLSFSLSHLITLSEMSCYVNAKFIFPASCFERAVFSGLEVSDFVFSVRHDFSFQCCFSLCGFTCVFHYFFGCFLNMFSMCFRPVSTGVQ